LVVAVLMIVASVSAFAEDPEYKITVTNDNPNVTIAGKTYQAFKLFDATYSGDSVSYTMSNSNQFYGNSALTPYFTFTPSDNDATVMVVTLKQKVDKNGKNLGEEGYEATYVFNDEEARKLADALKTSLPASGDDGHATVPAGTETVDIPLKGAGYYIVYGTADNKNGKEGDKEVVAALGLTTAKPTASVKPKVDAPKLNKKMTKVETDGADVSENAWLDQKGQAAVAKVGSTVSYELDSAVPDLTGYTKYTYIMHDAISGGLTYVENSFDLKIGGSTVEINPVFANDKKSFTLTIPYDTLKAKEKGAAIVLTYKATINDGALTTDYENNTAYLTYSHSPYDDETNDTPEEKTYVIDINIDVTKVAEQEGGSPLADAEFKLYREVTSGETTTKEYYSWDATNKKAVWGDENSADVLKTNAQGKLITQVQGLDKGTYKLVETKAPQGYNLLTEPVTITIAVSKGDDNKVTYTATGATVTNGVVDLTAAQNSKQPLADATVINNGGQQLPSTGGIGTTLFYIGGGILVLAAVILLVTKRRMNAND